LIVRAVPIGGLRMIDKGEADDKLIAVLESDAAYGSITQLEQCPPALIERLRHYFLTYKQLPTESERRVEITDVYGADEARRVVEISMQDYQREILSVK
jgi:inorganic pyrophosphatase